MKTIVIDGNEYDLSNVSQKVLTQVENIRFVDEQLLQRNNEYQIALTAKIGYSRALEREMNKIKDNG